MYESLWVRSPSRRPTFELLKMSCLKRAIVYLAFLSRYGFDGFGQTEDAADTLWSAALSTPIEVRPTLPVSFAP